jgi:nucleotide-binding universal stress UspA family protein
MSNRQRVLVAIDGVTDVERTMEVALSTAKGRGADLHVIQVVPHRAVHIADFAGVGAFEPHDKRGVGVGARLASVLRSTEAAGVRVQRVTLRGEPERVSTRDPSARNEGRAPAHGVQWQ